MKDILNNKAKAQETIAENCLNFQAHGTSWFPLIRHGETILVQPIEFGDLKSGDFILYRSKQGNVIAGFPKKEITPRQLIGKVSAIYRKGKMLKTASGLLPLMRYVPSLTPCFLLIYKTGCKLLHIMQKSKLYRRLMRRLFGGKVSFKVADNEEQGIASILACFGQSFLDLQSPPNTGQIKHYYIIAKMTNNIIASVCLSGFSEYFQNTFDSGWWISGLFAKPFFRGLGIGEGLMQKTLKILAAEKAREVYLTVRENNQPAIKLYKKLGFTIVQIPELDINLQAEVPPGKPRRIIMKHQSFHLNPRDLSLTQD